MTENEFLKYIDDLISWINVRRRQPLILSDLGADTAIKALNEYKQYHAIGAVEECREARERQRTKKPVYPYLKSLPTCPNCGEVNLQQENEYGNVVANYDFCPDCGQAISWE